MKRVFSIILFCAVAFSSSAQFSPPAGQAGSDAIHKDSSLFVSWASHCKVSRGYIDISNPSLGTVFHGDSTLALGIPNGTGAVSLGDGGYAVLEFPTPIVNGPGADFAVFENAFVDTFLELAFVEVSSDGINFYRFPATSNTQDSIQVGSFGGLDATKLNNLAGKYIADYGTPFDLEELKNEIGLDVNHITHVKVKDVVGCIQDPYATYDKNNHAINDPWRTDFATGGFDLDAVGVIHTWPTAIASVSKNDFELSVFPNPCKNCALIIQYRAHQEGQAYIIILDPLGRIHYQSEITHRMGAQRLSINWKATLPGIYFIQFRIANQSILRKVILE